jgi:two-component system LytT family response regulator
MKLRVLITDDEPMARERLHTLLTAEPNIEIVGVCENGQQALSAVREHTPDVVFLDVRMPEMDGFTFLETMPAKSRPLIIIVTAHEKYAAQAFEIHAVDFLLKPFDRARLRTTLNRARERIRTQSRPDLQGIIAAMRRNVAGASTPADRISIKNNGRIVLLKYDDIDWVGAAGNYVEIHAGDATHLMLITLTSLEVRLPTENFVRVGRSTIINAHRVKELRFEGRSRRCVAVLLGGVKLPVSPSYRSALEKLLGR